MPSDPDALAFGDVVLVPFPFTDQSAVKRRPAVVISRSGYNARQPDAILMPITSQLRADARPDDLVVDDWQSGGLLKPSAIKSVITTFEQSLIIRRLGRLGTEDRAALARMIDALLAGD